MSETPWYALEIPPPSYSESEHDENVDPKTGAVMIKADKDMKENPKEEKGFVTKLKTLRQEKLARPTSMNAYCSIDLSELSQSEKTTLVNTIPSLGIKISMELSSIELSSLGDLPVILYDIDKFNVEFHKKIFDQYHSLGKYPEGIARYHLKFTLADF